MRLLPAVLALAPGWALAESETATALEPMSSPYMLKLTLGLVLVVVAIFVLAWLVKKFNLTQQSSHGLIRIVAGLSIGTRDRIVLLQVGDEQILLGLTPGRIAKLHTLSQPLDAPDSAPVNGSFASKLNRLMNDKEAT